MTGVVELPLSSTTAEPAKPLGQPARRPGGLRQFVVGQENRLLLPAIASCLSGELNFDVQSTADATQSSIARSYNPIVLVGAPGTGKSHIALGLAQHWRQAQPKDLVTCTTGGDYARELTDALDTRTVDAWRRRYRASNLLVFEDLHQLGSRTSAQIELLHTLDVLESQQATVIATSRLALHQIPNLLPALNSRLAGGLSVPLSFPGLDARRALVGRLAAERKTAIDAEALALLAERVETSASELFAALVYLETSSRLDGGVIRLEHARRYLDERSGRRRLSLRTIATQTAHHFAIPPAEMKSASRRRAAVQAHGVAMHLARQLTASSLERIGAYFGGRDHTTVLHSCRKIEQMLSASAELRRDVEQLTIQLKGG